MLTLEIVCNRDDTLTAVCKALHTIIPKFSRPPHDVLQILTSYVCAAVKHLAATEAPSSSSSSSSKPLICKLVPAVVALGLFKEESVVGVEHLLRNMCATGGFGGGKGGVDGSVERVMTKRYWERPVLHWRMCVDALHNST